MTLSTNRGPLRLLVAISFLALPLKVAMGFPLSRFHTLSVWCEVDTTLCPSDVTATA